MDAFSFYIILNAFVSVKRFSPFFFSFFSIFKKDVPFPETRLPSPAFNNAAAWRIGGRNDSRLASPEAAFPMFRFAPLEKTDHFPFFALRKNYKDFVNPLDFPEFSGKMMQEILTKLF